MNEQHEGHTAIPWHMEHKGNAMQFVEHIGIYADNPDYTGEGDWRIPQNNHIATVHHNSNDAAYIVRACNSLPALVQSLEWMLRMCEAEPATRMYKAHIEQARAALALARGSK